MFIKLRLWRVHYDFTLVHVRFFHLHPYSETLKNCLSKIILVYGFGQKNKINYDNYGLINLSVDGVFFKERLTINQVKTNYSYMQVCVWNISATIKDTV